MSKELRIGLFGFGCVGQGLYDVLEKTKGFKAELVKICVKSPEKKRTLPASYFTFDKDEILNDTSINLVVELIDDADAAYDIVTTAIRKGKDVVTANKKMLAEHLEELVALQKEYNVSLLYEAAACGSIPIIRNLEEYYDNDLVSEVQGIFNGSSNYILTKVFKDKQLYNDALKEAQDLGFAETNPILDVGGFDPKYKLVIIALHGFGVFVRPESVFNIGIQHLSERDFNFANEKGRTIKLVPRVVKVADDKFTLFVMPQLVKKNNPLYRVEYEYNGVIVEAAFSDRQFFYGKGAGSHPTGSAVLSDISAIRYDYKYEYKKTHQGGQLTYTADVLIPVYLRYNDPAPLRHLELLDITERYTSPGFNYVIAKVSLRSLIDNAAVLDSKDVFIAYTGEALELEEAGKDVVLKDIFEAIPQL